MRLEVDFLVLGILDGTLFHCQARKTNSSLKDYRASSEFLELGDDRRASFYSVPDNQHRVLGFGYFFMSCVVLGTSMSLGLTYPPLPREGYQILPTMIAFDRAHQLQKGLG